MPQGWRYWLAFCKEKRVSVQMGVDGMEFMLSDFVAWMVEHSQASGSTVVGYMKAALQHHALVFGRAPFTRSFGFKLFLDRVARAVPGSRKLVRHPLALRLAVELAEDAAEPLEFRSAVALGMRCLLRGGEMFTDVDNKDLHVLLPEDASMEGDVLVVQVRADKSHSRRRVGVDVDNDPFPPAVLLEQMFQRHFALRLVPSSPLLVDDKGRAPSLASFRKWLTTTTRSRGVQHILPHSLRIGGAVALAAAGVSAVLLQAIGGWSSQAWMNYVHPHIAVAVKLSDKLHAQLQKSSSFPDDVAEVCGTPAPEALSSQGAESGSPALVKPQARVPFWVVAQRGLAAVDARAGRSPRPLKAGVSLAAPDASCT